MKDDGKGPYTHCMDGYSHCLSQNCPCTPTMICRLGYHIARGTRNPLSYLYVLVTSPIIWILGIATIGAWVI
jgi:hypothetical protein